MIQKQFYKNVLPSMLAFAFSGVYVIVDGLFIGRNIGDSGLAAINIAFPITALMVAAGTGVGMGGAIQIATCLGKKDAELEKRCLGNTLTALSVISVLFTIIMYFASTPLLKIFGAQGEILALAQDYIKYIIYFSCFQILATGIVPIIRNYNGATIAMYSMIAGFITNVVLDWLFVSIYPYGMAGAAVATTIGQGVTVIPCIIFLLVKKKLVNFAVYKPDASVLKKIAAVGLSPFGLTLSPHVVTIIMNKGAFIYGGAEAVACFAVVNYIVCIVQLLLQGIGDGCQPLISRYNGADDFIAVKSIRKMAYIFALLVAVVNIGLIVLLRNQIPILFGVSKAVAPTVSKVLMIYILGFIFVAFLRVTTSYFYAVKKNTRAYMLIYGEPLLLAVLVTFVFPQLWGMNGIWAAIPVTQGCLMIGSLVLLNLVGNCETSSQ